MKLVAAGSVQAIHGRYHLPKVETETSQFVPIVLYHQSHLPSYTNKLMKLVAAGRVQAAHGHCHLPKVVTETWPFVPIGIYHENHLPSFTNVVTTICPKVVTEAWPFVPIMGSWNILSKLAGQELY